MEGSGRKERGFQKFHFRFRQAPSFRRAMPWSAWAGSDAYCLPELLDRVSERLSRREPISVNASELSSSKSPETRSCISKICSLVVVLSTCSNTRSDASARTTNATRLRASNATKMRIIMTLPETFFPTRESTDTLGLSLMIQGRKDVNPHTKTPTFCLGISLFLSIYDPQYFKL